MEENLTGRYIKALVNSPQSTGVKIGETIKIIRDNGRCTLDTTSSGISGMSINKPLNLKHWELLPLETTKKDVIKVNDWIVRTTNSSGGNKVTKGKSYQVIEDTRSNVNLIDDEGNVDNFDTKYFRLAEPHEIPKQEPPKPDMKAIQEECKRRFPIGCKFISSCNSKVTRVLKNDSCTYSISEHVKIYAGSGQGLLYKDGVYAQLMSLPKTSLVGRWLKALVDRPQHTFVLKGEYVKILDEKYAGYEVNIGFNPNIKNDTCNFGADPSITDLWQLMPEEFSTVSTIYHPTTASLADVSISTIKQKPLIENVQSISVNLRIKKTNKFKF
jgi:hypothetical protein